MAWLGASLALWATARHRRPLVSPLRSSTLRFIRETLHPRCTQSQMQNIAGLCRYDGMLTLIELGCEEGRRATSLLCLLDDDIAVDEAIGKRGEEDEEDE